MNFTSTWALVLFVFFSFLLWTLLLGNIISVRFENLNEKPENAIKRKDENLKSVQNDLISFRGFPFINLSIMTSFTLLCFLSLFRGIKFSNLNFNPSSEAFENNSCSPPNTQVTKIILEIIYISDIEDACLTHSSVYLPVDFSMLLITFQFQSSCWVATANSERTKQTRHEADKNSKSP